jgi:ferredoxin-type protein NapF
MIDRKRPLRLYGQFVCFAVAAALLWPLPFWKQAPGLIIQFSPYVAIGSCIALRSISAGAVIGLILAIIAIWKRRWFCRYACPIGLLVEASSRAGLQWTSWWRRLPQLGQYLALSTFFGAAAACPIFLWMDPLAIFSSILSVRTAAAVTAGVYAGLLLGIILLLSLTAGTIWCARLCPLGAVQDLLALAKPAADAAARPPALSARRAFLFSAAGFAGVGVGLLAKKIGAMRGENAPLRPPGAVAEERFAGVCIRCGSCIRACPSNIIHPDIGDAGIAGLLAPVIRYEKKYCLETCAACTHVCPSGALQVLDIKRKQAYIIGEALVDGSICLVALGQKDCDACVRSCPFDAVHIHWDKELYAAWPAIDTSKCNGCGACEVACPTGEIKAIRVWRSTV